MLVDLRSYDNLGTPKYFFELLCAIKNSTSNWQLTDVEKLFYNKIIDGRTIFDGCFVLATKIKVLNIDNEGQVLLNPIFNDCLNSEKQMCDKFVETLLLEISSDNDFQEIFSSKNLSYDIIYRTLQINNSAFSLKYANFKQLLLDFEIISIHPTKEIRKYIFNSRYKKLFDKSILPEIKKRKLGIEELRRELEQKKIHGEEAEIFVLGFEKIRLNNKEGIEWVAEFIANEGYDVSSFNSIDSVTNDRFIEVKSYSLKPYFFWSRNEMDVARIKADKYFLYLVNRDQMNEADYVPLIIQDPYKNVLDNPEWLKEVDCYRINLNEIPLPES